MMLRGLMLGVIAVAMVGCQNNQELGRVLGGVVGAGVGNQFGGGSGRTVATVAGALVGSVVGERIGRDIDEANRLKMREVLEDSPSNRDVAWVDPDTRQEFVMRPQRSFRRNHQVCRPFTLHMVIDGERYVKRGVACRRGHGVWEIVE